MLKVTSMEQARQIHDQFFTDEKDIKELSKHIAKIEIKKFLDMDNVNIGIISEYPDQWFEFGDSYSGKVCKNLLHPSPLSPYAHIIRPNYVDIIEKHLLDVNIFVDELLNYQENKLEF